MNNMVSIIICFYNEEKYIKTCLDSILNQTYKNLEIIAIDDCSNDDSRIIAETYKNNLNIKIIKNQENKGPFVSRVIGCTHANGEYITFIDADDCIHSHYIERAISKLEREKTDIIYTNTIFLDNSKVPQEDQIELNTLILTYLPIDKDNFNRMYFGSNYFSMDHIVLHLTCNKIIKKKLLDKSIDWLSSINEKIYFLEDMLFWSIILSENTSNVSISRNSYYYYTKRDKSSSSMEVNKKNLNKIKRNLNSIKNVSYYLGLLFDKSNISMYKNAYLKYTWDMGVMIKRLKDRYEVICNEMA